MSLPVTEPIRYDALVQDERVHASLYTDPRVFADEMDRIFFRGWVFVGHESEIPRPGDFVTRHIGTQPVILARAMDGEVAVLLNRCAHRGTLVCAEARGNTRTFSCPYHGWTYDLTGDLLGVPYPAAYDGRLDRTTKGLATAARVGSYRGFVFACFEPTPVTLEAHLGAATALIDRACDLSPEGRICLTAGWVKHRCPSNWKMLPENDLDGYHLGFVHMALFKTIRTQYNRFTADEKSIKGVVRDWGNGHTEIDWSPAYDGQWEWFGGGPRELVSRYVTALEARDGREVTERRLFEGPPHALIFPNLFLGEMNIAIVQPVSVEESVHWHTPMFLEGVPEFDRRLLRQSEAAMGPASFLLPDDLTITGRNQIGLHSRRSEWLELSRGVHRESVDADGRRVSNLTDETTNRGFFRHYRAVMTAV
jgi:phenylpropionate dioxygenase-like ring-hydroxylating dioxygenase large terminal subunit